MNHCIDIRSGKTFRLYPRPTVIKEDSSENFIAYLDGYSGSIKAHINRELFGLTKGLDGKISLTPLAAKGVSIRAFTPNRGEAGNGKDIGIAWQIPKIVGANHDALRVVGSGIN